MRYIQYWEVNLSNCTCTVKHDESAVEIGAFAHCKQMEIISNPLQHTVL